MTGTYRLHDWSDGRNPLLEEVYVEHHGKRFSVVRVLSLLGGMGRPKRVLTRRLKPYSQNASVRGGGTPYPARGVRAGGEA